MKFQYFLVAMNAGGLDDFFRKMNATISYHNDVWSLTFSEWLNALSHAQCNDA
jgi:hypothetical protein